MPRTTVSVVIRALDEAQSLDRCLRVIAAQRLEGWQRETIVVDGGSSDATVQVAVGHGARVVELPREVFSYGRSLNLGCANARGAVLVALSAHAYPLDDGWLERLLQPFDDPDVACATGDRYGPDGGTLNRPLRQDERLARERPDWGYSNGAGAFRAELWRRRPFRADLIGCEDKEWALHWLGRGYVCVVDPSLVVEHDHSKDPLPKIYARARVEAEAYAAFLDLDRYGAGDLARDWWGDLRWYDSALRARLSHRRTARLLGAYVGRRRGSALRRRDGQ